MIIRRNGDVGGEEGEMEAGRIENFRRISRCRNRWEEKEER